MSTSSSTNRVTEKCSSAQSDLKAYVDGELSAPRRWVLRTHLNGCAACRREMEEIKQVAQDIREWDRVAATENPAFSSELRAKVLTRMGPYLPDAAIGRARPAPYWRQQPILVFSGGLAAALVSTVVFLPLLREGRSDFAPSVASVASQSTTDQKKEFNGVVPIEVRPTAPPVKASPKETVPGFARMVRVAKAEGEQDRDNVGAVRPARRVALAAAAPLPPVAAVGLSRGESPAVNSAAAADINRALPPTSALQPAASAAAEEAPAAVERVAMAVPGLQAARSKVEAVARAAGGYVVSQASASERKDGSGAVTDLLVKVPADQRASFLSSLESLKMRVPEAPAAARQQGVAVHRDETLSKESNAEARKVLTRQNANLTTIRVILTEEPNRQ